jgi:peptide deformylase
LTARLILKYPDARLRLKSAPVNECDWSADVEKWCADISDTMKASSGLGLAAPQIGICKRIFTVDTRCLHHSEIFQQDAQDGTLFFINPQVTYITKNDAKSKEACLSVPNASYSVKRSSEIDISYTSLDGNQHNVRVKGMDAAVIQHEFDHLSGKLFIDRLNPFDRKEFLKKFKKPKRKKTEGEINQLREQKRAQARKNRKK